jgi:predicted TIM-barrel fold metal-dependent hydrolase
LLLLEPYIDAHCHVWTPDVAHYPLATRFKVEDMKPPSFTAEELLAVCRAANVGRVNLIQMSFYGTDNSVGNLTRQTLSSLSSEERWSLWNCTLSSAESAQLC